MTDKDASINPHATNKVPTDGLEIFFSVGQIFILKKKDVGHHAGKKENLPGIYG